MSVRTLLALAGVAISLALLGFLALSGNQSESEGILVRFEAAGIVEKAGSRTTEIELTADGRRFVIRRTGISHWSILDAAQQTDDTVLDRHVATALHFLEVSPPTRVIESADLSSLKPKDFGLDPARYTVALRAKDQGLGVVEFGNLNPSRTAQYVRIAGKDKLYLMPPHVGQEWEAILAHLENPNVSH